MLMSMESKSPLAESTTEFSLAPSSSLRRGQYLSKHRRRVRSKWLALRVTLMMEDMESLSAKALVMTTTR